MTYAELKTNIANFLNRSDLTSQLDFFIDATEAEFNRRLRVKDMIKRATATADSQYLSLPTDWLEAINVQLDGNNFTPLMQQSIESLDIYRKSVDNVSNQPVYYALVDNTIELAPTPDTSYTLQLTYYGTIDALSDSNTSNFISNSYPDAYLYGALKHASIYLMEDDRVALFTQQFEKALEEMRLEQEKAEFGKGSLMQRRRTYGKAGKNTYVWKNN
jgi:Sec7-like guanine-nucleotide exchange factor|tara:strand:- start:414 stop:1064 length:651 start_codon:yes stop_codon:yes gene_type:complete